MMQILDLPNELVDQIVSKLHGLKTELYNLSLVSRRLHDITKATLYGTYSYELFPQGYSFRPFLRTILRDPLLSSHTRIAKIRAWQTAADVYSFLNEPDPPRREDLELFVDAGRYVPLNSEPDWYESMIRGVEDAEVMLLISQLPNLQELHLAMPPTTRLRWHFVTNEAQKARHGTPAMYHSLRRLCVEDGSRERGFNIETLAPFLGLPSLQTFEAYQCHDGLWTASNFNMYAGQNIRTSGITYINFEWSILSVEAVTALITSCKALKSFKFSHHYKSAPRMSTEQFNTRELMEALSSYHDSLEHLKLDLHTGWDPHEWIRLLVLADFQVRDLRAFRKLETLDVEQTALMTEHPDLKITNRPLAAVLPASIRTLIIRSCTDSIVPALLDLASSCKEKLPWLKKIKVTATKERTDGRVTSNIALWDELKHLKKVFGRDVRFEMKERPDLATNLRGFNPPPPTWRS